MEMVWCNSCKTVIWAYDHHKPSGLSQTCNMFQLSCPRCGTKGNFDGWAHEENISDLIPFLKDIYDGWSTMKAIARQYKVSWEPSEDNTWK